MSATVMDEAAWRAARAKVDDDRALGSPAEIYRLILISLMLAMLTSLGVLAAMGGFR